MKITAAVVSERHGKFELQDVLLDEPGEGEVLVRVVATGAGGRGRRAGRVWGTGRFPFDELVTHFPFARISEAIKAAEAGEVIKPVPRMP